jgi:hypothetical protein
VFIDYNRTIWPIQPFAWVLGAATVWIAHMDRAWSSRFVLAALALMWMWTGIAYHVLHFAEINRSAYAFGGAFIVEAVLFMLLSLRLPRHVSFRITSRLTDAVGCGLIDIVWQFILSPRCCGHTPTQP